MKPEWELEVFWSFSTPLTVKLPSWKNYPVDLFLQEFILLLRMRGLKELGFVEWVWNVDKGCVMSA